MCVCKETYEKLGLVGQKMPFKNRSGERYGMLISVCCCLYFTSFPLLLHAVDWLCPKPPLGGFFFLTVPRSEGMITESTLI